MVQSVQIGQGILSQVSFPLHSKETPLPKLLVEEMQNTTGQNNPLIKFTVMQRLGVSQVRDFSEKSMFLQLLQDLFALHFIT